MSTTTIGRDSIEVVVAAQWARITGQEPGSLDTSFFEVGGNSFAAARLAAALREATGVDVPLSMVFDHSTIRQQGSWLREESATPATGGRHLLTLKAQGDGAPLVLLPGGGGNLVGLGEFGGSRFGRPVHGLLAPGFAPGESVVRSVEELSAHCAAVLEASEVDRRVHLLGFCGGGVFAYHLAGVLRARGWDVLGVTLLETSLAAPDLSHEEIVRERIAELAAGAGIDQDDPRARSAHGVFDQLRANGVDLLESDVDAFTRRLDVFASLWRSIVDFRPEPIDVPVVLFSPPDRLEDAPEGSWTDWCDLGLPRFRQVDVDITEGRLNTHQPTLDAIEAWLRECEGSP